MNLKSLSDGELLRLGKEKSSAERAITLEVIKIIREVERRRLFLDLGYGSLFDYVTKELKFDSSSATRRIDASRLLRDLPEIEEKISNGNLSLSNLTQAQVFFRKEAKLKNKGINLENKREILLALENKSRREAEKTLLKISPNQIFLKETKRVITSHHTEIKLIINDELYEKLERIKKLISHKNPNPSYSELISELADIALKKLAKLPPPAVVQKDTKETKIETQIKKKDRVKKEIQGNKENSDNGKVHTRYIPTKLRQKVWLRDEGKCTFVDPVTNRRCESTFQVQYHHENPFAKGGNHSIENIKLLCSQHNKHMAIKDFGKEKMQMFLTLQ